MKDAAEHFIWLTARVIDQRRFAYLFGDGTADGVLAALDAYRNPDGGYGWALEPDGRGPVSQPIHVLTALEILDEIGRVDPTVADHLAATSDRRRRHPGHAAGHRALSPRALVAGDRGDQRARCCPPPRSWPC